jgi:hypothetical protein
MKRCTREGAALLLIVTCLLVSMGCADMVTAQPLTPAVESAVVGGGMCDFAAGVAVGLDVGGFFGCVPCAFAGLALSLGVVFAC